MANKKPKLLIALRRFEDPPKPKFPPTFPWILAAAGWLLFVLSWLVVGIWGY